jgi:STE24 endopeptidase
MSRNSRSQEYSRIKERLGLLSAAFSLAGGATFVGSGLAAKVNRRLLPRSGASIRQRLRYQSVLSLSTWIAAIPLAFYNGYVIEKRFELSRQTPQGWALDAMKSEAMSMPVQMGLVEGMQWTMRRWPRQWWLVVSGAAIPLTSLFVYLFPVLIAPRFNKYEPLTDKELDARLRALAERSGLNVAEVMQMDMSRRTSKANAFFAGVGHTKRIVISDTMLEQFTHGEIETVVAHEAGHQVNRDLWRNIAASSVFTLAITAATDFVGRRILEARPELVGTSELGNPRALPVIALSFGITGALLAPIQLAYSRAIESRTDRFALELTGNGADYASALDKLAQSNLADPNPPRWVVVLMHSHPPLGDRIDAARSHEVNALWTG